MSNTPSCTPKAAFADAADLNNVLRSRRRTLAVSVLVATLLIAAGFMAGYFVKSPAQIAAETAPPTPGHLVAQVARRTLAATIVLRGSVTSAQSLEVAPTAASGRAVVTGLRVTGGTTVGAGQVLAEVSGRPVFVLPGMVPIYRDIRPGSDGQDVEQLQIALRSLGQRISDTKGRYGNSTKEAVRRFYDSIGFTAPSTGPDDARSVAAAQDTVVQAERRLVDAKDALAQAPKNNSPDLRSLERGVVYARQDLARAQASLGEIVGTTGPMVPLAELVFVASLPARIEKVNGSVGAEVKPPFLVISSGRRIVKAQVTPADRKGIEEQQVVKITAEVLGLTAQGRVARLGELQKDEAGRSVYPMDIEPDGAMPDELAGQNVRLTIETARTAAEVLVVPLSALTTNAEGNTSVTRVTGDGKIHVEVVAGLSGGGFVEVRPVEDKALSAGDTVVIG